MWRARYLLGASLVAVWTASAYAQEAPNPVSTRPVEQGPVDENVSLDPGTDSPAGSDDLDEEKPGPSVDNGSTQEPDISTMSEDELYLAVFNRERPAYGQSRYPVMVDGVLVGDAGIDPSDEGWIEKEVLQKEVLPFLLPDAADALRAVLLEDRIPFSVLRSLSYDVSFDNRDLVLVIEVPLELRTERSVYLSGPPDRNIADTINQASVSGFVSVRAGADWIQSGLDASGSPSGLVADIDAALNIKGVVLEGSVRYSEDASKKWRRDDVRLVYDDVANLVRYELGDLTVGRRPNQTAPRIAGFGAYREFRIDPYDDPRPVGEQGLVLERAASVEILVNGVSFRTVNLPAGRFSLRDFPIMPGAVNDIEFVITYATGEVERVFFPAFASIDLLEEGTSEFAINVGVPYEVENGSRSYDTGEFNLMGFWRKGFSPTLTMGGSIEANSDLLLVGPDISWASPIGSFDLSAVMDLQNPGLDSGRLILRHALRSTNPDTGMSLDSLVILTGDEYRTLDQLFSNRVSTIFAQTRFGMAVTPDTRIQVGGSYEKVADDETVGDRWTAGVSASHRFKRFSLIGSLDWSQDNRGSDVAARISFFMPLGRGTLTSSYATRGDAFRTEYRRPAGAGVGSFGYGAGVEFRDGTNRQFARANYVGNRFEAAIEQERFDGRGPTDVRTGFALGSALVMADGRFGLSRPVTNSFAIVGSASEIDAQIAVDPRSRLGGDTKYSAWSDFIGPAVVPDLPAYLVRDLEVEAPDAPVGAGVGGEVFVVRPGYKSGFVLSSGSASGSVSALGNMVDRDGDPIAYASGTVRELGSEAPAEGSTDEAGVIFTNSAGRFFVEGLEPNKTYEVIMDVAGDPVRFEMTPPEDAIGIWNLGENVRLDVDVENSDESQ